MADLAKRLEELRAAGLHRRLRQVDGAQGPTVDLDGTEVLLMCSNNYLGLADDPQVRQAAANAAERFGAGAGASRLVSGNMALHRTLERRLARFKGFEAALVFGSGYLANTGVIPALARRGEVVFSDELNHASIIDGCRLAGAETFVYRHRDTEHLAWGIERAGGRGALVVTDGVFSMDGDVAPLPDLHELTRSRGLLLMVDEAHATGAVGPDGRGTVAAAGLEGEPDVIVIGTLGKALGSYGAYACGSAELVELLVNSARSFIFSTALPPACIGAAIAALGLIDERSGLVERLRANSQALRDALVDAGLDILGSRTQIVPIMVGGAEQAVALSERALMDGVFAQAIRPPTVPEGTSRLRVTAMATHRREDLVHAAGVLARSARALGAASPPRADRRGEDEGVPRAA